MIPVYNRQAYIGAAIESVLRQTYTNFELIVHDDASSDNTPGVLALYHDPRLRVIRTEANHGMIGGWNYLLKRGRGEFIKQMGSDDLLAPNCLAKEVSALLAHPSVALVTCQRRVINEAGELLTTYQFTNEESIVSGVEHAHWILTNLRENKIGEPCAALFRRSLIAKAGLFDPLFSQFADFEYWLRLLALGDLMYLPEPLCSFRTHPLSNTTAAMRDGRFITEIFALIHKYYSPAVALTEEGKDYREIFALTPQDRTHVTRQKTLDTLKNIKDLIISGNLPRAFRYSLRLSKALFTSTISKFSLLQSE